MRQSRAAINLHRPVFSGQRRSSISSSISLHACRDEWPSRRLIRSAPFQMKIVDNATSAITLSVRMALEQYRPQTGEQPPSAQSFRPRAADIFDSNELNVTASNCQRYRINLCERTVRNRKRVDTASIVRIASMTRPHGQISPMPGEHDGQQHPCQGKRYQRRRVHERTRSE